MGIYPLQHISKQVSMSPGLVDGTQLVLPSTLQTHVPPEMYFLISLECMVFIIFSHHIKLY